MIWHGIKHTWLVLNFLIIVLGGGYVFYLTQLDGDVFNKPITYQTDIQNLRTEKSSYKRGEVIRVYTSFCKTHATPAVTTWGLFDGQLVIYSPKVGGVTIGCFKDVLLEVGMIPSYLTPETAHMEGEVDYQVNKLRTIKIRLRTQNFQII